jgi:hypothetical protein
MVPWFDAKLFVTTRWIDRGNLCGSGIKYLTKCGNNT